jgi:hypothetical protein
MLLWILRFTQDLRNLVLLFMHPSTEGRRQDYSPFHYLLWQMRVRQLHNPSHICVTTLVVRLWYCRLGLTACCISALLFGFPVL